MNVNEKIIPGKGLGGFSIGHKISDHSKLLEKHNILGRLRFAQVGIYSTQYLISDSPIEIYVDTRTGLIYKISAVNGYKGKFDNSVGIGTSAKNVLGLGKHFYYSELDEVILSSQIDGIAFELNENDPLPEEIDELNVEAITVFNPDLFKPWNCSRLDEVMQS